MDEISRPRHRRDPEQDTGIHGPTEPTVQPVPSPTQPAPDHSAQRELTVVHHPDGAVTVRFFPAQGDAPTTRLPAVLRALVVSTLDPLDRGRLEITVPSLGQSLLWAESGLAPGDKSGPDVGEQVWVAFEEGDPQRPVWIGLVRL